MEGPAGQSFAQGLTLHSHCNGMAALTELQGSNDAAALAPGPTQPAQEVEASTDASTSAAAAAMLDKLALLDEVRKQERERRREETRASADPRESVACFLKGFASRQRSVEDALQRMLLEHQQLQETQNGTNSAMQAQSAASSSPSDQQDANQQQQQLLLQVSAANPESVAASLELLTSEVLQLEQSAAAASYYLPLYDQKQCANTVAAQRAAIEAARGTLAPRKRFTFGSKKVNKVRGEEVSASAAVSAPPSSSTAVAAPHPAASTCSAASPNTAHSTTTTPASSLTHGSAQQADANGAAPGLVVSEQDRALVARGRGLLGLYDTVVVRRAEEVAGGDFVLLGLTRCTVVLLGQLPALRMVGLRGCRVVAGPVTGACFVDDVQVGAQGEAGGGAEACRGCRGSWKVEEEQGWVGNRARVVSKPCVQVGVHGVCWCLGKAEGEAEDRGGP